MRDPFEALRAILQGAHPSSLRPEDCVVPSQRRLLNVLNRLSSGEHIGPSDLAVLVRHVLRNEQERQRVATLSALVPSGPAWPTPDTWQRVGIDADEHSPAFFRVQARRWEPSWLATSELVPIEQPVFAETPRRNYASVPGDPFLRLVQKTDYRSTGQRVSVRAVLTAPAGATLVVNLPTGAGKSLCAHLPALLRSESHGVTVVVVPTTALCIDQENAIRPFVPHATAHHGGATAEQHDRNVEIRRRIVNGTQRIVFTSPESLVGALSHSVYKAARAGLLRYLVIDEAHMVEQWGDEFRSAFQELAGMRVDLLRNCPAPLFQTVLLTATLTESCLDTIETLFARPGPFAIVSGVQVRPEPAYWGALCATDQEKDTRVLEAVHHLPRPLLLYVTRIRDANTWIGKMRAAGFARCEVVTGATSDTQRRSVLDAWRDGRIDLVVATSAFGLGVDKDDIRGVIHACVPENVDRYYQEVGRGGRDGNASISLILYTRDDLRVAEGLNHKKIIGIDRGRERWSSMFRQKESTSTPGRYRVRVNVPPSFELGDIDMVNDYNVAWNVRTLTLMARARMIELDADPPPSLSIAEGVDPDLHKQQFDEAVAVYHDTRVVRVLSQNHESEHAWSTNAEGERLRSRLFAQRNLALMREILDAKCCVAATLSKVYGLGANESASRAQVWVAAACGGCNFCRRQGIRPYASPAPIPPSPWAPRWDISETLRNEMGADRILGLFYDPPTKRRDERALGDVLAWFAVQGVQNFVAPAPFFEIARLALEKSGIVFLSDRLDSLALFELPRAPTLIVHPPGVPLRPDMYVPFQPTAGPKSPRVLLFPTDIIDPEREGVPLRDRFRYHSLLMDEFRSRYSI
jgi:ATP-dependent DNA helicase RecQ